MQRERERECVRGCLNKCNGLLRQLLGPDLFMGNTVRESVLSLSLTQKQKMYFENGLGWPRLGLLRNIRSKTE